MDVPRIWPAAVAVAQMRKAFEMPKRGILNGLLSGGVE